MRNRICGRVWLCFDSHQDRRLSPEKLWMIIPMLISFRFLSRPFQLFIDFTLNLYNLKILEVIANFAVHLPNHSHVQVRRQPHAVNGRRWSCECILKMPFSIAFELRNIKLSCMLLIFFSTNWVNHFDLHFVIWCRRNRLAKRFWCSERFSECAMRY
jgi:hypothetical protein